MICTCKAQKEIAKEVQEFIRHVDGIKEESITDFLVWKWSELDKRFKHLNVETFSRHHENKVNGADFSIELWLVGQRKALPCIFQAKMLTKELNGYRRKLNYPNNSKQQMNKLINYSKLNPKKARAAFYAFYASPPVIRTRCSNFDGDCGVYITLASEAERFADGHYGKQISKSQILDSCHPLYCLFCCKTNSSHLATFFAKSTIDFSNLANTASRSLAISHEDLPTYVHQLLDDNWSQESFEFSKIAFENELKNFRHIGVYDLRNEKEGSLFAGFI